MSVHQPAALIKVALNRKYPGEPIIKHNVGIGNLTLPPVLPGKARPYVNYAHDNSIQSQYNRSTGPCTETTPVSPGPRGNTDLVFMPPRSSEE